MCRTVLALHRLLCSTSLSLLVLGTFGCASNMRELYEQSRAEVMRPPPPPETEWRPDVLLGLGWPLIDGVLADVVDARLNKGDRHLEIAMPLGAAVRIRPEWSLRQATIRPATTCPTCANLESSFDGVLTWSAGPLGGRLPVSLGVGARVEILTLATEGGFSLAAEIEELRFRFYDTPVLPRLKVDLDGELGKWVRKIFEKELPKVTLAEIGQSDMPVRLVRVLPLREMLRIEALSSSPAGGTATELPPMSADWSASVSSAVLLGLARKASFEEKPLDYDIRPEIREIAVDGSRFILGLRLWRLEGRGWWRDYEVQGSLGVSQDRVCLDPERPVELAHSKGAGLVDPLAALGKSVILASIEEAATLARPARFEQALGTRTWTLRLDSARGVDGSLIVEGTARPEGSDPHSP